MGCSAPTSGRRPARWPSRPAPAVLTAGPAPRTRLAPVLLGRAQSLTQLSKELFKETEDQARKTKAFVRRAGERGHAPKPPLEPLLDEAPSATLRAPRARAPPELLEQQGVVATLGEVGSWGPFGQSLKEKPQTKNYRSRRGAGVPRSSWEAGRGARSGGTRAV